MLALALALRSLRFRVGSILAGLLSVFLGATILMAFASMLDTRAANELDPTSRDTLFIVATVVGGWGLLLVAFAAASTLTLAIRQRGREIALLKSVGATPAQVGRMIVGEAALVALVGALLAIAPAILLGRLLLALLQDTGQVAAAASHSFGPIAIALGLGITFLAATAAALVAARRAARVPAVESLRIAAVDGRTISKKRVAGACFSLALASTLALVTATVMSGTGIDAMQTAGQASLYAAIGFALLAPLLIRTVTTRLVTPMRAVGAGGVLAALNVRGRTQPLASALMPIIIFTATTGPLYMQNIENGASPIRNTGITAAEAKNLETLNYVVVGLIAAFAAILLINTLVAATSYRRQELGQLRLAGSTPTQALLMVTLESLVLIVTGVVFGTLAALFTIVPYSIARTDSLLPDTGIAIYLVVVAAAAIMTLTASVGTAWRAVRTPATEAVASR